MVNGWNLPRVSIGLPVYNGELFIRETLQSLLRQSYQDFEIIISNNSSSDDTERICREFVERDERIKYIRQQENIGAIENFRFVLNEARGAYFVWIAADDLQSDNFLEKLVAALDDNEEIVCVMSDVINIDDTSRVCMPTSELDEIRISCIKENWKKCRKRFFRNPTSNIFFCVYGLFRTDVVRKAKFQYRDIHKNMFSAEIPFLAQVALLGAIASIPLPLKRYRRHNSSTYHLEQRALSKKARMIGYMTVSLTLLHVIYDSNLDFSEKIQLYLVVLASWLGWCFSIGRRVPIVLMRRFAGLSRS